MLSAIEKTIDLLTTILGVIAGMALIYLIFGTAFDILMRHTTGRGFPAIIEYAEVVMVVLVYFSLAQTQREDGHVASDLVAQRLPLRVGKALEAFGLALVIIVLVLIVRQAAEIAWVSYQQGEYRLGLTRAIVWPARIAIVIGLAALITQIALRIVKLAQSAWHGRPDAGKGADETTPGAGKYL